MRRTWNSAEFILRSRDPEALAQSMDLIEQWREESVAYFEGMLATSADPISVRGSIAGIELQAHLRHVISAFTLSYQPELAGIVANAALTALAHCAALILAEGEAAGFPRDRGIAMMLERMHAVLDEEARHAG